MSLIMFYFGGKPKSVRIRAGVQAAARCPKLRVERRPFLAPYAVIFGVVFTGPYILVAI